MIDVIHVETCGCKFVQESEDGYHRSYIKFCSGHEATYEKINRLECQLEEAETGLGEIIHTKRSAAVLRGS